MEHKILSLCAQILATNDDDAIRPMLVVLQDELHQFIERLRVRLAEFPICDGTIGRKWACVTGLSTPENAPQKNHPLPTTVNKYASV